MQHGHIASRAAVLLTLLSIGPAAYAAPPQAACASPTRARGHFVELRVPGGTEVIPNAINDRGEIVGSYTDAQGQVHGFLYRGGTFFTIHVPGSSTTRAVDINKWGTIAGNFDSHSYVLQHGVFSTVDAPGAFETEAHAINDRGDIAGQALEPNDFDGREVGFVRDRAGTFERIAFGEVENSLVADINNRRTLLVNSQHGQLLRIRGEYRTIHPCRPADIVIRITDRNALIGTTEEPSLGMFVGLFQTADEYSTYRYPGSVQTVLRDVNSFGVAVGQAVDPVLGGVAFVFIPR
jgi:probable HAF family extracellular repeat protein